MSKSVYDSLVEPPYAVLTVRSLVQILSGQDSLAVSVIIQAKQILLTNQGSSHKVLLFKIVGICNNNQCKTHMQMH